MNRIRLYIRFSERIQLNALRQSEQREFATQHKNALEAASSTSVTTTSSSSSATSADAKYASPSASSVTITPSAVSITATPSRATICSTSSAITVKQSTTAQTLNALTAATSALTATAAAIGMCGTKTIPRFHQPRCNYCGQAVKTESTTDSVTYDRVCGQTLDALYDYFDELTEKAADLPGTDVAYSDGVLTVNLGPGNGTYVINRQSPNKQIWLSSPISGPKRFDYVAKRGTDSGAWIYKHSGESLHLLLQLELGKIFRGPVDFLGLPFGK